MSPGVRPILARWGAAATLLAIVVAPPQQASGKSSHGRYTFYLPDKYVGWIQVIFNDPTASHLPWRNGGYVIEVPESGIPRTSDIRVDDDRAKDEFYYRLLSPNVPGGVRPVPAEYVLPGFSHGGFGMMDTDGKGPGDPWFIFIGPPELRSTVPFADWDKVVEDYQKTHGGKARIEWSGPYPTPGRMQFVGAK